MQENAWYKNSTFIISLIVVLAFVLWGIFGIASLGEYSNAAFTWMVASLGWSFMLGVTIFVVVVFAVLFGKVGTIKLGADDSKPEFGLVTWFAMLFSAGMGIGLVFWGVSEPIWHYIWPPYGDPNTAQAVATALQYTFFHWGIHPWAIYALVGGSLAYFTFRKGLPMLISSTLHPILGDDGIEGPVGKTVNVISVFACVFGLATSLGLGAMQIGNGLHRLFWFTEGNALTVGIIVVITLAAIISTMTGIHKGIKQLSRVNMVIALFLLAVVFFVGPTLFILNTLVHSMGDYAANIVQMSMWLDHFGDNPWPGAWTVFYWAWWLAWAPFVGTFIARISKGRTLREFVVGSLLAPTLVGIIWIGIFGGTALHIEHFGVGGIAAAVEIHEATGFFAMLSHMPWGQFLIFLATISVCLFFITSSDSGTYVNGMLTSGGNIDPPKALRVVWGGLEGAVAAILIISGGIGALQTASVVAGFPFMIIMIFMAYCWMKALKADVQGLDYGGKVAVEKSKSA